MAHYDNTDAWRALRRLVNRLDSIFNEPGGGTTKATNPELILELRAALAACTEQRKAEGLAPVLKNKGANQ